MQVRKLASLMALVRWPWLLLLLLVLAVAAPLLLYMLAPAVDPAPPPPLLPDGPLLQGKNAPVAVTLASALRPPRQLLGLTAVRGSHHLRARTPLLLALLV